MMPDLPAHVLRVDREPVQSAAVGVSRLLHGSTLISIDRGVPRTLCAQGDVAIQPTCSSCGGSTICRDCGGRCHRCSGRPARC